MRNARTLILSLLTLSVLAGCGTTANTTVWRHDTVSAKAKAAAKAAAKASPAPAASTSPSATPSTTPAAPTTATFTLTAKLRGTPVAGYDVQVFDARTGDRFQTGATLKSVDAKTGNDGKFKLAVSQIPEGQGLRVVATKGGFAVETLLTAQSAPNVGVTVDEVSSVTTQLSQGVLSASQVLTGSVAKRPVRGLTSFEDLRPALLAALPKTSGLDNDLASAGDASAKARAVRLLVNEAGLLAKVARLQAEGIAEVAILAQSADNRATAATDPAVVAGLTNLALGGSVLSVTYDSAKATFFLKNTASGGAAINAATDSFEPLLTVLKK
jgi:hypothetical protein